MLGAFVEVLSVVRVALLQSCALAPSKPLALIPHKAASCDFQLRAGDLSADYIFQPVCRRVGLGMVLGRVLRGVLGG